MLESQDIKLWQGVETDAVISRDLSPPLARRHLRRPIGEREKKRDCEWWDKRNWQGGWAMEIMVGGEPEKWEARRFITPGGGGGGTRSALPDVWGRGGSYRALRLCFLWKLNACRVQSVTAEERTRIPRIGCEQRKLPARPQQSLVCRLLYCRNRFLRRRHPSKEMCNASSVTSLSMTYNYYYFIIMGIERRWVN